MGAADERSQSRRHSIQGWMNARCGRDVEKQLIQIRFLEDEERLMAARETAGPSTSLRSGRDDNVAGPLLFRRIYSGLYRIVIPTGASMGLRPT